MNGTFISNDSDPNGDPLSYNGVTIVTTGPHTPIGGLVTTTKGGTIQYYSDGTYRYTPPANFTGPDYVNYTICDVTSINPQPLCSQAMIHMLVDSTKFFTIAGNVYDDANGLTDNTVNGTGTNAGGTLYAVLYDNTNGKVAGSATVASNGTYSIDATTGNYSVYLSTTAATIGQTAVPTVTVPANWVNTGENIGSGPGNDGTPNGILALGIVNNNLSNVNFGIEQPPVGTNDTLPAQLNPGGTIQVHLPAYVLTGTDFEDGTYTPGLNGKKITLYPAVNGDLYYNGVKVTAITTIPVFDSSKLSLDPTGPTPTAVSDVTATFAYSIYDAAGQPSVPDTISVPFQSNCTNSFASNFNGTAIAAGNYVWFHMHVNLSNTPSSTFHVRMKNSTIAFTDGTTNYVLPVPNSTITFSSTATSSSYTYSSVTGYQITIPLSSVSNNEIFIDGLPFLVPAGGLSGGINPVTWTASFNTDVNGVGIKAQWSAAVYTSFSSDPNNLGIQLLHQTEHAGTPNNYKSFVVGGARGGGGSNYTGSWSATYSPAPCTIPIASLSISGTVFDDANGLVGTPANTVDGMPVAAGTVKVLLLDAASNKVIAQTTNGANGTYSFSNLEVGNYIVVLSTTLPGAGATVTTASLPANFVSTGENIGTGPGNDGTVDSKLAVSLTNANVTNANFGIEQPPVGANNTVASQRNPGGTIQVHIPGNVLTGTDLEDGTYPTGLNGKKVTLYPGTNGDLYYNGTKITTATTIATFDSSKLSIDPTGPNPTGYVAVTSTFMYSVYDAANLPSATKTITVPFDAQLCVNARVYLEGSLTNNGNATAPDGRPLMRDNLRLSPFTGAEYIPKRDIYEFATPYVDVTGKYVKYAPQNASFPQFQQVTDSATVFGVTGQNAIVDWVFVELRNKSNNAQVLATRAGLLQRDGDIVETDGIGCLQFPTIAIDSYYVAVRHRSHLGTMTKYAQSPANLQTLVDLTVPSTPLYDKGIQGQFDFTGLSQKSNVVGTYRAMWQGDFDANRKVKYDNPNDDLSVMLFDVILYPTNVNGATNYDFAYGYRQGDYDMNSKTKFDNPNDDNAMLLFQEILYPQNVNGATNYDFFLEQLP